MLLIGAPLAFAVTGTLHLVPAYEPTTGSDFDHVVPHWKLWTGIHVLQLVIISLLALAIATLTRCVSDSAARVSPVALVPFLAFYSAFDASVGLSGGLLARYVSGHPTAREEVSQAADTVTDPLSAPVLAGIYLVGVLSWLVAVAGAAVVTRRAGAGLAGPVVLVIGRRRSMQHIISKLVSTTGSPARRLCRRYPTRQDLSAEDRRALTELLVDKIVIAPHPHKIDNAGRR